MSLNELNEILSSADMIVCGYAFTKNTDSNIQVLHLSAPNHALVMSSTGQVLETSMDDVELNIVMGYWHKNQKHMEESYA